MNFEQQLKRRKIPFDDAVQILRQLAVEAERTEERFIRACMAMEESGLWREGAPASDVTFSQFLRRIIGIQPSRYERGAKALRDPELNQFASEWGMSAIGAIVEVNEPEARQKAIDSVRATWEQQKRPLPPRTASSVVAEAVGGKVRVSKEDVRREQIANLKRTLSSANRRISELESENDELRERLGDSTIESTKTRAKRATVSGPKRNRSKSSRQVRGNA